MTSRIMHRIRITSCYTDTHMAYNAVSGIHCTVSDIQYTVSGIKYTVSGMQLQ